MQFGLGRLQTGTTTNRLWKRWDPSNGMISKILACWQTTYLPSACSALDGTGLEIIIVKHIDTSKQHILLTILNCVSVDNRNAPYFCECTHDMSKAQNLQPGLTQYEYACAALAHKWLLKSSHELARLLAPSLRAVFVSLRRFGYKPVGVLATNRLRISLRDTTHKQLASTTHAPTKQALSS